MNHKEPMPPKANKVEKKLMTHGDVRLDNYYWMKLTDEQKNAKKIDNQTQEVVDYLIAENEYTDAMLKNTEKLQDTLFNEIVGRIKQTDMSVPYIDNGYYYITRYEEGQEYPIISRKKESLANQEEVMLDVNILAEPYKFYQIGGSSVSPNNKILAYGEDVVSRRKYTIRFKDLSSGEMLPDVIENTTGSAIWANDNKTIFYTRRDDALRPFKVYKHLLGTPSSEDMEILHEKDETFNVFVYKTKSKKYIVLGSWATLSQEFSYIDAEKPEDSPTLFQQRERNLEYSITHYGDHWFIRTNKDKAKNFKLMKSPLDSTLKENWEDVIVHREDVFLEGVELFKDYLVLSERVNGITQIRIKEWSNENQDHYIDFGEEAFTAYTSINKEFETQTLRVGFTSMTTPNSVYDYDMVKRKLLLLKQQEVVGDFDATEYVSERKFADAEDGTKIPISIVYKKGFAKDGSNPLLLYAYGSYGNSIDPYFSSVRLSLLDRGFGFAIAHIRGGQEMGRDWYENGKLLNKKNTFTDFIDCAKYLLQNKYSSQEKLYAMGGSAGGLLMGAIINMAPELWGGVIAAVPFVDVVTTMLDESIPLTTGEFDEWGNPKVEKFYHYIKSYSPYDNVQEIKYPPMLVTTGFHDSQVQYWEPAKWVAKLRDKKIGDNILLLKTNMETGHGGASGRFKRYKETALEYAFLLDLTKISE